MIGARGRHRLSTQVLLLQVGILLLTVAGGFVVSFLQARRNLDARAGEQSLAIARSVASDPAIVADLTKPEPAKLIDPVAERIRRHTGAAFIVVANRDGIRYSHPNPSLIGTSLLQDPGENPVGVLRGQTFVGVQPGSLGRSMRAKVPIRNARGTVIGLVSVGVLESHISSELVHTVPATTVPPLVGLAVGTVGAYLLARRVRRQTFGLEPSEIGALFEQREAMLHGVREGAIAVNSAGRITLVNDEGAQLVGLDSSALGKLVEEAIPAGRVRDVLTGEVAGLDQVVLVGERVLVVNRMPIEVRGTPVGSITTLRDRTDLEALLHELDDVRALADALRAQEHEFAHQLHVISGLIELGRYEDAVRLINANSQLHQDLAAALTSRIGEPIVSALLLGKASIASERGVTLTVGGLDDLPAGLVDAQSLVTILGNLIDNAIDSAAQDGPSGYVEVSFRLAEGDTDTARQLFLRVRDSGPGVDPDMLEEIFTHGFTTKVATGTGRRRGLGLAMVSQTVRRQAGEITVSNAGGAVFTVVLPVRFDPTSDDVAAQ